MKRIVLLTLILAFGLVLAACGNQAAPVAPTASASQAGQFTPAMAAQTAEAANPAGASGFESQSNDENSVTVEVTPLTISDSGMDVELAFNTHSVDLDFDPTQIIVFRDATGTDIHPISWDGSEPGGHHRRGTLHFDLDSAPQQFIELEVHDVAEVPTRTFRWELH